MQIDIIQLTVGTTEWMIDTVIVIYMSYCAGMAVAAYRLKWVNPKMLYT